MDFFEVLPKRRICLGGFGKFVKKLKKVLERKLASILPAQLAFLTIVYWPNWPQKLKSQMGFLRLPPKTGTKSCFQEN